MNGETIILLRVFGYLLNIMLFIAAILYFPRHRFIFGAWIAWLIVAAVSVMFRYLGFDNAYFLLIDYVSMPLLYVNAVAAAWAILKYGRGQ